MNRRIVRRILIGCLFVAVAMLHCVHCCADTASPSVSDVARLLKSGELADARRTVLELDDSVAQGNSSVDTCTILALVARKIEQTGDVESATELYQRSVNAIRRPAAEKLPGKQIVTLYLAAASNFSRRHQRQESIRVLEEALEFSNEMSPQQQSSTLKLLMMVAGKALAGEEAEHAERAYRIASQHADAKEKVNAQLGIGWALSLQNDKQSDAAKSLLKFVDSHSDHPDSRIAARLGLQCSQRSGDHDLEKQIAGKILSCFPESETAMSIMTNAGDRSFEKLTDAERRWLRDRKTVKQIESLSYKLSMHAIVAAIQDDDATVADSLIGHLASIDQTGSAIFQILQSLTESKAEADAERFAMILISPKEGQLVQPAAREIACQWAGRGQRWSMLAMAAESARPEVDEKSRTPVVEKLFAESLMQVGRAKAAKLWWDHLVDTENASDFPTLLRCAETAVAIDQMPAAEKRIRDARNAADHNVGQNALVDMLSAELAVRNLEFDRAREVLSKVTNAKKCPRGLRARAQWTIGETYFMQQRFPDAISAYRDVESIDPDGQWIPVSLVQAGKSFEQLGRTQQAAICYASLVSRYADGPYAQIARERLALIAPESSPPNDTLRR